MRELWRLRARRRSRLALSVRGVLWHRLAGPTRRFFWDRGTFSSRARSSKVMAGTLRVPPPHLAPVLPCPWVAPGA